NVITLTHALCWVMTFPKLSKQFVQRGLCRIENHANHFRMTRLSGTDFLVGRIRGEAATVANRRVDDAWLFPEQALRPPETSHTQHDFFHTFRYSSIYTGAKNGVSFRGDHWR